MTNVRHPNVAGTFYPANAQTLEAEVRAYLRAGQSGPGVDNPRPKALIAPHAGYIYSGPVAGSAYAQLLAGAAAIRRVVLMGPSHRLPFSGLAYPQAAAFLTPLGPIPVDHAAYATIADLPQARLFEAPFQGEHCLEVQLPFLQLLLADFQLVPFLVGEASSSEVAEILERLWGGDETLIVVSSDLSHYLDYASAKRLDGVTSQAIAALDPTAIGENQACGRNPVKGLLRAARRHGLRCQILDVRNSGDTAGPRAQVVGYGAFAFA